MTITNHDFESALIERLNIQLHALWRQGSGPPEMVAPGAMADSHDFAAVAQAMNYAGPGVDHRPSRPWPQRRAGCRLQPAHRDR